MILLALALALPIAAQEAPLAASINGLPIGELPRQQLPATGCAAYLWSVGTTHALVAMAGADPAQLRLSLDGTIADFPRVAQHGLGGFGFSQTTTYRAGAVTAVLDMEIRARPNLTQGAEVPRATLTIERPGKDTIVLPVGGLIGCAAAAR